jgi:hypothetical protein
LSSTLLIKIICFKCEIVIPQRQTELRQNECGYLFYFLIESIIFLFSLPIFAARF